MTISSTNTKFKPISKNGQILMQSAAVRDLNEVLRKHGANEVESIPSSPYRLKSALELSNSPAMEWRIKGVIPTQGIGVLYGPSGSGKSFLCLDMAIKTASGINWFGYRVKPCPVIYICLEGAAGLTQRIKAYSKTNDIPSQLSFIDQSFNLTQAKDLEDLITTINMHDFTNGIVIIDTLNQAVPGMDENSSIDMGKAIKATKQIQEATGGLVLLVHHSGKDQSKGMRGHSSLHAALDAAIEVKRNKNLREWSVAKAKDGADGISHHFDLKVVDLGKDSDGDPITSCVISANTGTCNKPKLKTSQKTGLETFMSAAALNLNDGLQVHANLDQWRTEFYRKSPLDNDGSKRKAFNRARKELLELGELTIENDIYYLPSSFPNLQVENGTNGTVSGHADFCPTEHIGTDRDTPPIRVSHVPPDTTTFY